MRIETAIVNLEYVLRDLGFNLEKSEEWQTLKSAVLTQQANNKPSMPVCPGMEKCENFGSCSDCLRHPILRDKWSVKPAYIG